MSEPDTLIFLTSFEYPSRHAHPIHGLEMARAWGRIEGDTFIFVISDTKNAELLYGIRYKKAFGAWGPFIRKSRLRTPAYFLWLFIYLLRSRNSKQVVFVNDIRIALAAALLRKWFTFTFIFESHGVYGPPLQLLVYTMGDNVVFVTKALQERACISFPGLKERSIVVPNAVDTARYAAVTASVHELRAKLHLQEGFLLGYVGRFMPGGIDKGVPFMVRALAELPAMYRMLLVGGTETEIHDIRALSKSLGVAERITFVPFVDAALVPEYCKACDVLAYVPEDAVSTFHQLETSPMKLFEYMAAHRPIIVSDTSAVREVLDRSCAFFITPGDPHGFAAAIESVASDPEEAARRSDAAFGRVEKNTWMHRCEKIIALCR